MGDPTPAIAQLQAKAAAKRRDIRPGAHVMNWTGVDPGKNGALCLITWEREIVLEPMPLVTSTKGRDEYDIPRIREILKGWARDAALAKLPGLLVTVERSQPIPPKVKSGSLAQFHRGVQRGFEWLLVGLEIPYQLAAPRSWQARMHAGTSGSDTKQRSILAAQRLFPGVDLRRSERARKPHDGMAEALLLAEFGRRVHQRVEEPAVAGVGG